TKFKRFVFKSANFTDTGSVIVSIKPRKNSKPVCSKCGCAGSIYDTSSEPRLFEFIGIWGFPVFFSYQMRRVSCANCGRVIIEKVPWSTGKHHLTDIYRCYLAHWAKNLSWQEVARSFHTSWEKVYDSVKFVVGYGMEHRRLDNVKAIGVDEIQYRSGHRYLTLIYQIDEHCRRLLWLGEERTKKTLDKGLLELESENRRKAIAAGEVDPPSFLDQIQFACSDMWKAYLTVIGNRLKNAVHILDRFHIMQHFGKALDRVRAMEAKRLKQEGYDPVLCKTRFCFLKRKENLTEKQKGKLSELLKMNLRTIKAYLLKEDFQRFWEYKHPAWAEKFLDQWCTQAMKSRIEPMKDIARMLCSHRELILNWFRAKKRFNSGIVEGLNLKWNLTVRKSFGFRTSEALKTASFHQLGKLPEPIFTHKFY
ncbi:MAG: ISL3 family transposase, partial [Desulfobacterales bacterium]|nr:ISL3 family transposase [Desulfobacterales bacterium]